MEIRHAVKEDIHEIMRIYEYARRFMAEHGNPDQWGPTNWPPEALIRQDIANGSSYVCIHEDKIVGTFFLKWGRRSNRPIVRWKAVYGWRTAPMG